MSHHATNWAIQQRGLKPATKVVLWHLADRHNPDLGCFPHQSRLAADCEMSRSALNEHLAELERLGLIRRVRRLDPKTKRQLATRYILGFEAEFTQEPCPETGHGVSVEPCPDSADFPAEPCPENAESRVRNPDSNNPVREPTTTPAAASDDDLEDRSVMQACLQACGPGLSAESRRIVSTRGLDVIVGWLRDGADLYLDVLPVLRARTAVASDRVIQTWDYFTPAVQDAVRQRARSAPARSRSSRALPAAEPGPVLDAEGRLKRLADWINGPGHVPPSAVSSSQRHALLARGLVTEAQLRARQIY